MQQEIEHGLRLELKERRDRGEDAVIYAGEVRLRADLRKDFHQLFYRRNVVPAFLSQMLAPFSLKLMN